MVKPIDFQAMVQPNDWNLCIFFSKPILHICFINVCLSIFLAVHMIMHFMLDKGIFYIFSVPSESENYYLSSFLAQTGKLSKLHVTLKSFNPNMSHICHNTRSLVEICSSVTERHNSDTNRKSLLESVFLSSIQT